MNIITVVIIRRHGRGWLPLHSFRLSAVHSGWIPLGLQSKIHRIKSAPIGVDLLQSKIHIN